MALAVRAFKFSHVIPVRIRFLPKITRICEAFIGICSINDLFKRLLTIGRCNSVEMHLQGSIAAILMLKTHFCSLNSTQALIFLICREISDWNSIKFFFHISFFN